MTRQRTYTVYEKLSELKSKKVELEDSLRALEKEAGPQEKNRLLEQVKEDNQETSAMERKLAEMEEQATKLGETLSQLDIELDSQHSDRNNKYEELLKRDKEMQNFIDSFDERKKEFADRNSAVERSIVTLLDRIKQEHKELQGDLKFKEKEMKNSANTMDAILIERDRRLQDLEKVNQLETKLQAELEHLRKKVDTQTADMARVSNVEGMKEEAETKKMNNAILRDSLKTQRNALRQQVQLLSAKYDGKKAQLQENETYTQLGALEQRLKNHESNNFHLKEYINAKLSESDYKTVQTDVYGLLDEINGQLFKIMSLPPAR
ncbi:Intraflagellar transport protein 74 [Phlyctochytrium planicorne]|nr:Intraflagellar transport protein 74 [Phlyctochytrium planicorne]